MANVMDNEMDVMDEYNAGLWRPKILKYIFLTDSLEYFYIIRMVVKPRTK